jgi:hypothetical protein
MSPLSLTLPREGGGDKARQAIALLLVLLALAATACSPEAGRARSSGPGADIGNRPDPRIQPLPELHPVMDPAFGTPRLGLAIAK